MYNVVIIDINDKISKKIRQMNVWKTRKDFNIVAIVNDEDCAMDIINSNNIDIIFLAVNNRRLKEIKFLHEIKDYLSDKFLILISENSDYVSVREGFLYGAFDYILSPIKEESLVNSLNLVYENFAVKFLEEKISDKINEIVEAIIAADKESVNNLINDIIEKIYEGLNYSNINGAVATVKAKQRIYEKLIEKKSWLVKFVSINYKINLNYEHIRKDDLLLEWHKDFEEIINIIDKYKILNKKLIVQIGNYVVDHIDDKLSLDSVAKAVYLNKSYVSHIFKRETGISFVEFLTNVKVDRARILLLENDKKVHEIANQVGFTDTEYFSKIFKNKTGLTPTQYRKEACL